MIGLAVEGARATCYGAVNRIDRYFLLNNKGWQLSRVSVRVV